LLTIPPAALQHAPTRNFATFGGLNRRNRMHESLQRRAALLMNALSAEKATLSRRDVLRAAMSLAAASMLPGSLYAAFDPRKPRFTAYPFTLGVASGYPRPDRVTLWTRLAPEPLRANGGMWDDVVHLDWEVAEDEAFKNIVQRGSVRAAPELAHSARITVRGLAPDRSYFYRFICGDAVSRSGRTRTAPAVGTKVDRYRLAIGSCQHFEQAWFSAHRHAIADNIDLMVFLGDYIYESNWGDELVRRHVGGEASTLAEYRIRHAQYKTDGDLQNSHAAVPWVFTWDDHEVDNDYAGAQSEHLDPAFLGRRAAAYQAFYEHQPMPLDMHPLGPDMKIYTSLDIGSLARIHIVDNRQYRSAQPCPSDYKGGGSTDVHPNECATVAEPSQTMLGSEQETWLSRSFTSSKAQWNLIAQQTLLARFDGAPGPERLVWTDGWDAFPAARQRMLDGISKNRVANPIILGGDIHASVIANVHANSEDNRTPIVAAEFCGTSIGSQGWDPEIFNKRLPENPHVLYGDTSKRGYIVFDLNNQRCAADLRILTNEKIPESTASTAASFIVESGKTGVRKA
jgi:alkaline phosphatase D